MSTRKFDFTALDVLARCEQEYVYRHQMHLARAEPDPSAYFGQVVHAGVRAVWEGLAPELVDDAVRVAYGDYVAPPKKAHLGLPYAQSIVQLYRELYGTGGDSTCPFDLVLNEQYLEHPERDLCGVVDRVVRSKADGQLYVMDLKTTGLYLSPAWFEQWRHSLQAAIYLDLVEHWGKPGDHQGEDFWIAGFWVDAIHVDRRGFAKPEDFLRVGPFAYSPALRAELRTLVDGLICRARDLQAYPAAARKNPRQCWRYNTLCSFFSFCTAAPSDRADLVKMALGAGELITHPWNPAKRPLTTPGQ